MSMFKNSTSTNPPLESTLISVNSPQPFLENTPLKPTPSSPVSTPHQFFTVRHPVLPSIRISQKFTPQNIGYVYLRIVNLRI